MGEQREVESSLICTRARLVRLTWSIGWHQELSPAGTVNTYKKAVLKLYDDHSVLDQDMDFQDFMRRVKSREIKKIRELDVDLDPVLQFFSKQGLLSDLPVKALTEKLCWMLTVVGMIHSDSIRCIDLSSPDFKHSEDFVILPILRNAEASQSLGASLLALPHVTWTTNVVRTTR
jgi:hypothetical protein